MTQTLSQIVSVERQGVRLCVREVGESAAPAALCIHGLNANMAFWNLLLVRKLSAQRRLIMYDQRGHGRSDLAQSGYTSDELARDAVAILDDRGAGPVDVIAHSFGATVALQLARLYPERVRSLVILDGRVRILQPAMRIGDWHEYSAWKKHFDAANIVIDEDREIDLTLPLLLGSEAWAAARAGLEAEGFFVPAAGPRAEAKYRKLLQETTALDELYAPAGLTKEWIGSVPAPVQLLYGGRSAFLPTRDALRELLPGAQYDLLPEGAHNFPLLQPEWTAERIVDFWDSLEG